MGSCICNIDNVSTHLEGNKGFPTNSLTVKNYATLCASDQITSNN